MNEQMLKDEGKEEKGFWGEEQGKRALGCKAFAMHFDILQAWNFCQNVWLVFLAKKMTNASGINRKVFSKYFLQYATVFWLLNGSNIYNVKVAFFSKENATFCNVEERKTRNALSRRYL